MDEDLVVGDQVVVFGDLRLEVVEELLRLLEEPVRQVGRDAADPDVVVRQAVSADVLEQVVDPLPLADGVQERGEGPHVGGERPEGDQVGGDPVQFAHDHPDVLRPFGDLDAGELFHGPRPRRVAVHRGEVVEPVGERHELRVGDPLADLLQRPVQVPHVRLGVDHHLAVGAQDHPEHPVGARVLRPHVDEHLLGGKRFRVGLHTLIPW